MIQLHPRSLLVGLALLGSACSTTDSNFRQHSASESVGAIPVVAEFPPTGTYEVLGACSFTVGDPVVTGEPQPMEKVWREFDLALGGVAANFFRDSGATAIVACRKSDSVREYVAIREANR